MLKSNLFKYIVSVLISLLLISLTTILLIMKIIPIKYILIGISCLSILTIALIFLIFKYKYIWIRIVSIIYSFLLITLIVITLVISSKSDNIINKLTNTKYETISYSVITLKDKSNDISSYNNTNMGVIKNMEYMSEVDKEINKIIKVKITPITNLATLIDKLMSYEIDTILIENSYLDIIEDSRVYTLNQIKTIYTFSIKVEQKDIKKSVNVKLDPFIVLISGIDVAGPINTVSRSDVNIIMIVNPKTYRILLIHIPRDYYVSFHNLGTKDKLTHTGIYGIDMTVATIEDFMDIDINYYIRINFSTLTKLIDLIGDIEVYNPVAFSKFKEGNITLNGKEALAFSRARKMLPNGDLDRGSNQERVLGGIIKKLSVPNVATKAYDILNVMSNSFITNLSSDELKSLINFQLDRLPNWNIETYNLNGTPMYKAGTPFYPYYPLYLMEPDINTINSAKILIEDVISIK